MNNRRNNLILNKIAVLAVLCFTLLCAGTFILRAQATDTCVARKPIFAFSTNVLYNLAITPNVAIELPLGQRVSLLAEYAFHWWVTPNNVYAWQMLKGDLGLRFWLSKRDKGNRMDVLKGHFIGLDFGAGYYDLEPGHTGYQGEFQTACLEYGYAWPLGKKKHWRLQAYLGVGWFGTVYRFYEGDEGDVRLYYKHDGRFNWFGPTKVGLSFQYIINTKTRRK